jgi:hypothetical protein
MTIMKVVNALDYPPPYLALDRIFFSEGFTDATPPAAV